MLNIPLINALAGWAIALLIVAGVLIIALIVLYFLGKKAEKTQEEQKKAMDANSQNMSLFVIDKKKMKLKEAGLPSVVTEQAPKLARMTKIPIVKAKAGPRIMNFVADEKVYEQILPKQEIKATVSGIYITSFRRVRGPVYEPPKKVGFFGKIKNAVSGKDKEKKEKDK